MTKLLAVLLLALSVAQPAWAQFDKVLKGWAESRAAAV